MRLDDPQNYKALQSTPQSPIPSAHPAQEQHAKHDDEHAQPVLAAAVRERPLRVGKLPSYHASAAAKPFPVATHRRHMATDASRRLAAPPRHTPTCTRAPRSMHADIDAENRVRLAAMSADDISAARAELLASLEPSLVESIRHRVATDAAPASAAVAAPALAAPTPAASAAAPPPRAAPRSFSDAKAAAEREADARIAELEAAGAEAARPLEERKRDFYGDIPSESAREMHAATAQMTPVSMEEAISAALREAGMHAERFDLHGELAPEDAPVSEGLHHHGDEPDRAGYTLAELLRLSRSAAPAQRAQALRVLAAIFTAQRGGALAKRIALWCREADAAPVLRLALDDGVRTGLHAALAATAALAALAGIPTADEVLAALPRSESAWRGYEEAPRARAGIWRRAGGDDDALAAMEEEAQLGQGNKSDGDLAKEACRNDLMQGWCEMALLERLRYLLEMDLLEPAACRDAIALLCGCATHSVSLASRVAATPRMADAIGALLSRAAGRRPAPRSGADERADGSTSCVDDRETCLLALALLHLVASSSREAASRLLGGGLLDSCRALVVAASSDQAAAAAVAVWRVWIAYGLTVPALEAWFPLFSKAMMQPTRLRLACALFGLLEVLCTPPAAAQASAAAAEGADVPLSLGIIDAEAAPLPDADAAILAPADAQSTTHFGHLSAYLPVALACLRAPLTTATDETPATALPAAALHFLASYARALPQQRVTQQLPLLSWCEAVAQRALLPMVQAGDAGALGWAARALAAGAEADERDGLVALELALGYTRLWWYLTRLHRGLLFHLVGASQVVGMSEARSAAGWLWRMCTVLTNGAVGRGGRLSRASHLSCAGRLSSYLCRLLDAMDSASAEPATPERAASLVALGACGLDWMRDGDETLALALLEVPLLSTRWLERLDGPVESARRREMRPLLIDPFREMLSQPRASQLDAQARAQGNTATLSFLRPPLGSGRPLPLPVDWLFVPTHSFAEQENAAEAEARQVAQLRSALELLQLLAPSPPLLWVRRSRLVARGLNVFTLCGAPWLEPHITALLQALFERITAMAPNEAVHLPSPSSRSLLAHEPAYAAEDVVRRAAEAYLSESMGDVTFTAWLLLPLRTFEPERLRLLAWGALDDLSHKLDVASPTNVQSWSAAAGGALRDGDALLGQLEASLASGNLSRAPYSSWLRRWALHQIASAVKGGGAPALAARVPAGWEEYCEL